MKDTQIEPQNYINGVNVVDIGEARISRGESKRPYRACRHLNVTYDKDERRVYCHECESTVDAFDVLLGIVEFYSGMNEKIQRRVDQLKEAESFQARSRAVKVMDEVWRSQSRAPMCPHCSEAILPEDVASGVNSTGKKMAQAKRKRKQGGPNA